MMDTMIYGIDRGRSRGGLVGVVLLAMGLGVGGCGDFFAEKSTELEAEKALNDLTQINAAPDPNIGKPVVYETPPEIVRQTVSGVEEYKLFYYCKYHTSDKLKQIINDQFATQLFDEKGKSTSVKDYTVSSSPATNQLVVRCPTEDDADAVLEVLRAVDIAPIQVKIDCIVSEVYADLTMDRETTVEIKKLFGEDIFLGGKRAAGTWVGSGSTAVFRPGELYPAFPGAALREVARSRFGLLAGYNKSGDVTALIDILESRGYLKIVMNPNLEVVNGQTAKISSTEHVPLQQVTSYLPTTGAYILETKTEYIDVVDSLEITPFVFADGYIGLQTAANISSKNTPEGVKQVPIVTKREITNKENRIRQGESLIIGGIRKSERFAVVRGVPFLKDIPLLGLLFSSKDFEERAKETIFILTPTISTGGMPRNDALDRVRKAQEPPVPVGTLHDAVTDPFGFDAREREQQREILGAEEMRLEAEKEKALARGAIRASQQKVAMAEEGAARAVAEAKKVSAEALKTRVDAEAKAKAADAAKAAAEKAIAEAANIKATAEKIAEEAQKGRAEADRMKADADLKAKAADAAKAAADKAALEAAAMKADAESTARNAKKSKAEGDRAKADAEAKAKAADEARAAAEKVGTEAAVEKVAAQKAGAEATAVKAAAEKAAAEANKSKVEADKAKADATAKAKAAEQAKAAAEAAAAKAAAEKKAEDTNKGEKDAGKSSSPEVEKGPPEGQGE